MKSLRQFFGLLACCVPIIASAEGSAAVTLPSLTEPPADIGNGKKVFNRSCAICHGQKGSGGLGPALKGIRDRLAPEAIAAQIVQPKGEMPKLYPKPVGDQELRDVVGYLLSLE